MKLCEICLKYQIVIDQYNPGYRLCKNCWSYYSPENDTVNGAQSRPAKDVIKQFKGYNDLNFINNKFLFHLLEKVKTEKFNTINSLDIGCFDGGFVNFMGNIGFKSYGIDIKVEMVKFCQNNSLNVFYSDFPLDVPKEIKNKKYRLITSLESIYYWNKFDKCIELINDLLISGGYFLIKLNQSTSNYYKSHSIQERTGDFTTMLNIKGLNILMKRHGFFLKNAGTMEYVFDRRLFKSKGFELIKLKVRRKILSKILLYSNKKHRWDKIILMFQKK